MGNHEEVHQHKLIQVIKNLYNKDDDGVKSLESVLLTPLFSPSITDILSYICFLQTYYIIFSFSEICKPDFRINFDRSPRMLTEYNRSVRSQGMRKVRGQKQKSLTQKQTDHSARVTQVGYDVELCVVSPVSPVSVSLACFPVMLVLPGESTVSDLVRLGVASLVSCSKSNFVLRALLPTVCLCSQVLFFSLLLDLLSPWLLLAA